MLRPLNFPTFLTLAAAVFASALTLTAAPRTFTSPDGQKLQAELVSATKETVTLKLMNGQTITTQVSHFSAADIAYIAEWVKLNPVNIRYDFENSITKEKIKTEKGVDGYVEFVREDWIYHVKLKNRSGQTLEGLKVSYDVYFTQVRNASKVQRKTSGNTQIVPIQHLEEITFKTISVKLQESNLKGGYYWLDGSRSRQRDTLDGVALKIHQNGKKIFEWASPGAPKDALTAKN